MRSAGAADQRPTFRFSRGALVLLVAAGLSLGMAGYAIRHIGPGVDFLVFYRAARTMARGASPYSIPGYVSVPGLAVLLEPLTRFSFRTAELIFLLLTAALAVTAVVIFGRQLGWRRPQLLAAGALISWIGLSGLIQGQVDAVLLAALLGGAVLAVRGRFLLAGLLIGLVWLKPDVMWPAALFAGVALWPNRSALRNYLCGLGLTTAAFLGGGSGLVPAWINSLVHIGVGAGGQSNLAGLPVLLSALPPSWGLGLGFGSPVTWSLLIVSLAGLGWLASQVARSERWRQLGSERRMLWAVGLSMGLWLLVAPYAHSYDDLLLLPLLALVIGRDAAAVGRIGPALSILLLAAAPIAWLWVEVNLISLAVATLLVVAVLRLRRELGGERVEQTDAAVAGTHPAASVI
ncbi:MAG: glycosyltransferase family 87 protein [Candidatus Dormiibacterota bacterium]